MAIRLQQRGHGLIVSGVSSTINNNFARVRQLCLALPTVAEKISHGAAYFYLSGKAGILMFADNHHNDGRRAVWCKAVAEAQATLVEAYPDHYFVPPYVGAKGWVGIRLDRPVDWGAVAALLEDAWASIASQKLRDLRHATAVK